MGIIFWSFFVYLSFIIINVEWVFYGDVNVLFFKGVFDRMKGFGILMILIFLEMGG